jgi:hypothetical protein
MSLFTNEEGSRIIVNFILGNGGEASAADIEAILEWAQSARIEQQLPDGVLSGEILVSYVDGEPMFSVPNDEQKEELRQRFLSISCVTDEDGQFKEWAMEAAADDDDDDEGKEKIYRLSQ